MWAALVFLSLTSAVSSAPIQQGDNKTVTVKIDDGVLRGWIATSAWNKTYFSFQGVPFAEPPIGELRFKSPKPVKPWTGVRDATEPGLYCIQQQETTTNKSEDCLYLNVYVPKEAVSNSTDKQLAVLVWIHGGGYTVGAGFEFRPDNFMNYSVVLVTINYRLGALGFLSLEHPEVTSNAALKDQVAALRWVKKNIKHFGGNPHNVTVFGESAGGISVDFLQLSPMSKGLFHQAITQSGSIDAVDFRPHYNRTSEAFRLGEAIGFNGTDVTDLVKFLRSVPAEDILKGQNIVATEEKDISNGLDSFPVVDAKIQEGSEVFLPDKPENLLRAGKAHSNPYIMGFNSEEGNIGMSDLTQEMLDSYNSDPEELVPNDLNLIKGSKESLEVAAKIKSFYFGNKNVSFNTIADLINLKSDTFMIYNVYRSALLHVNNGASPVYLYEFTYDGTLTHTIGNITIKGPAHGDDLYYLFIFKNTTRYNPSSDDLKVIHHFMNMWTGFAQTGNPSIHESVKWIPLTKTNHTYLQINEELSLHQDPLKERMAFWDKVYETYRK